MLSSPTSKRILVLVSGSGSNLQAIIDECAAGFINGKIVGVISNVPKVFALQRATAHNIPNVVVDHTSFENRMLFDHALAETVNEFAPDLIVLAGFMRILSESFVSQFSGRMLNIHPSLLPKYPGLHTHKKVIENGDAHHGASVHFVTAELDGGPVVLQSVVDVNNADSIVSLQTKLAHTEWLIYPLAVKWFCQETLRLKQDKVWFSEDLDFLLSIDKESAHCKLKITKGLQNDEDKR
ncbi:MAG: phosphoribosylglycinamide formyltransferase-1 [Alphaproteobacteria bacterium]